MQRPGLFGELKRRHVWRVAIAYAIAGWLIVQIATQVFPFFGIPDWAVRFVVILIVIGLPVALAFAWIYELTPEGLRRTAPARVSEARDELAHRDVGRKLNAVIMIVLVLVVALMGWRLLATGHGPAGNAVASSPDSGVGAAASGRHYIANAATSASATSIPEKSVAVLPFANDSGQKDQQFFSDGLSEDLITALSQFAGLKVISRNSAFQFRDSKDTSAEIGKLLGVAHLLEGSVQRAGDEVRITATLVNAADGSVLWTQRYDKPYKDLFALQDAITRAVANALKAKLLTMPGAVVQSDRPPSGNLDAYAAYLRGRSEVLQGSEQGLRQAVADYGQAIRLDPHYARAYAEKGRTWASLGASFLGGAAQQQANDKARSAIEEALRLNPDLVAGYTARSYLESYGELDWKAGLVDLQHALQLAPGDGDAKVHLGALFAVLGQVSRAISLTQEALMTDPRNSDAYYWLSQFLSVRGHPDAAKQAIRTAIGLQPRGAGTHAQLAFMEIQRGDAKAALAAAQQESNSLRREIAVALALQIGSDRAAADAALKKLIADQAGIAAYQIAEVYALRGDAGNTFKWLDQAWSNRDPGLTSLLYDPLILRYRNDPRFAAFCRKVGLPTTTDAVAMP